MAYAALGINGVLGSFVEKDHGKIFEYIKNPELVLHIPAHGGRNVQYPHLVCVGALGETRQALVKGNVVHIVTNETDFGFVIEKWNIKKHRKYTND